MTITHPFTSGSTHAAPPPSSMASTERDNATFEAIWPSSYAGQVSPKPEVEWHVTCPRSRPAMVYPTLAAAENVVIGSRCPLRHMITMVKLDGAES